MKNKLISLLCILMLAGCYGKTEPAANENDRYFLFATPLRDHTIWLQAKAGLDSACDFYHVHCDWIGPNVIDTEKMNEVIETGILQKADGIITQGVIDPSLIQEAKEDGIPLILVDSDQPDNERFAYMGKDFKQQAELMLKDVEKHLGTKEKLKIAIQVAESDFSIAKQQIEQIKSVFQQHPGGYELVDISDSKSDIVRAKREWKNVLSQYPDINVAINFAAESAEPCAETAKEMNIRKHILIYAVDDMPVTISMIKNGDIDGSIVTSFYDYGYQSIKLMMEYLAHGKKPESTTVYPTLMMVTKENVDTYKGDLNEKK